MCLLRVIFPWPQHGYGPGDGRAGLPAGQPAKQNSRSHDYWAGPSTMSEAVFASASAYVRHGRADTVQVYMRCFRGQVIRASLALLHVA